MEEPRNIEDISARLHLEFSSLPAHAQLYKFVAVPSGHTGSRAQRITKSIGEWGVVVLGVLQFFDGPGKE